MEAAALQERASALLREREDGQRKLEEVTATAKAVDDAGQEAKEKMKGCTDFILSRGQEMKAVDVPGQPPSETKQTLAMLLQRTNECTRGTEATLMSCREAKERAVKKAEARKKDSEIKTLFSKYDADNDGFLNRREALKYAKSEFDFTVPNATAEAMFKVIVEEGDKGVKCENFHRLRVAVGIAREKARDADRRAAREEKERKIAEMKAELQDKVKEAEQVVDAAGDLVDKAEALAAPLPIKSKTMASADMVTLANETDEAIKEAREEAAKAKKEVAELSEGVDVDLQAWMMSEQKKLEIKMARFEVRLTRATNLAQRFREDAKKKEADELYALEKRVLDMIRHHQQKNKMKGEDVFVAIDTNKDEKIDETEFIAFVKKCERPPKKPRAAASKKAAAEEDGAKEDGAKEDGAKDEAKAEGEEGEDAEEGTPSDEEIARVFGSLDEEEEGTIGKDKFTNLIRTFMKVSHDTVITESCAIKDSKTLRRLEKGEVVEILEGPLKEDTVGVVRVRATAMKDELEGWITLEGNQGTIFLEEGGTLFRVIKETILTESFELDGGGAKDATRKLKDTTRKLKEGEVVEVREWSRREERSGLMRMKCKVKSDGMIGWVTTVGNQGTTFLEVL